MATSYDADKKPSELDDAATPIDPTDYLVLDQAGSVLRVLVSAFMSAILEQLGDDDGTLTANSNLLFATQQAVKEYVDAWASGIQDKVEVVAATTANGTDATAFENGDTIDGVVLATGNRFLRKNQTAPAENGIFVVNASGAPTRATDADSSAELVNATVLVTGGTVNARRRYRQTVPAPIVVGTDALTWVMIQDGSADVRSNTAVSVANELALFADAAGKTIKRSTGSGYPLMTSGVFSVVSLATLLATLTGDGLTAGALAQRVLPPLLKSVDYTLVAADSGFMLTHPDSDPTTPRTWTIPANGTVAWPIGTNLTFVNQYGASAIAITIVTDKLRNGVTGVLENFALAAGRLCTAVKVDSEEWMIA